MGASLPSVIYITYIVYLIAAKCSRLKKAFMSSYVVFNLLYGFTCIRYYTDGPFEGIVESASHFFMLLTAYLIFFSIWQEGGSVLYEAPADTTATLTDWVALGTVYAGGEIKLLLTLIVPATVGNEFQDAKGSLKWQFKSDELPIDTGETVCPECGETMVVVDEEGNVYHKCGSCLHEEGMHCPVCGKEMTEVIVRGEDGKYYVYYACVDEEHHHTDPVPKTGESGKSLPMMAAGAAALAVLVACVALKRRKTA